VITFGQVSVIKARVSTAVGLQRSTFVTGGSTLLFQNEEVIISNTRGLGINNERQVEKQGERNTKHRERSSESLVDAHAAAVPTPGL
jgi:hypothetical protein